VTTKRRPADVLREARKRDSMAKRARVLAVVDDMKAAGEPITFLVVAKAAGVSNWLVYATGMREHIEAARKTQHGTQRRERQSGTSASAASLAVDLELARAELRRTQEERDRLKAKVQRSLGQQVDQAGNIELERRIRELGDELYQHELALAEARAERDELRGKLSDAQDTVAALRMSLKQMMRDQAGTAR
jgi:flagellar biosynthesis chaperone FliJ